MVKFSAREAVYNLMIKSQSFGEPVSLGCDLHKCLSASPLPHVGDTGRLEGPGVGYFPSSMLTLAMALVKRFPLIAGLNMKNDTLGDISKCFFPWAYFKRINFPRPNKRELFSGLH